MGMEELLQNKLFLQYLAGAGADLSAYGADTSKGFQPTNVNAITQQNIKSQNLMKLLKGFLGPDGSSMTLGPKGVNMNLTPDSAMFSSLLGGEKSNAEDFYKGIGAFGTPSKISGGMPQGGRSNIANPFGEDQSIFNASSSDLAGLTTEDITTVLGAKHAQDQLKQQSFRDIVDAIYKGSTMQTEIPYKRALTKQAEAATLENTPSVDIKVGDTTMKVTPKDAIAWERLKKETTPNEIKLYEYARDKQGYKGSIVEFKNIDTTGHKKDYDEAVKGGYKGDFNTWMLEMAKAGAMNLGEKITEKKGLSELAGQLYFNDPKWTTDLSKHLSSEDVQNALFQSKDPKQERAVETVKFVEGKITAGGGVVQDVKLDKDGKTMVWKVKWSSGDVKEIRYAIRS